ncbi:hypothetical protein KSP40_PGU010326 [Platanthera guangdongensis]|uniref:Senescence regulator n=1 Tax=Platanthera guangdongensis TaxID=2320717 RepID=A0ABR2LX98_9ASPA
MAASREAYRFFTSTPSAEVVLGEDFDESDIWGITPADHRMSIPPPCGPARKNTENGDLGAGAAAGSLPVSIPDWSRSNGGRNFCKDDGSDEEAMVIPPHELLGRNRTASFSVHEGIGRTLKGRDLSRVRDSIMLRIGFQD